MKQVLSGQDKTAAARESSSTDASDALSAAAPKPPTERLAGLDLSDVLQVDDTELSVLMSTGC